MRQYYEADLRSDDDAVPCHTRDVSLAVNSAKAGACALGACPLDPECSGSMVPSLSEPAAYLNLSHLARQLDVQRLLDRLAPDARAAAQTHLSPAVPFLVDALRGVQRLVSATAFHWVRVSDFFAQLSC
jgi:hypothetical protein